MTTSVSEYTVMGRQTLVFRLHEYIYDINKKPFQYLIYFVGQN
jgi:hypothetical protein